jgi:hypothetical protein
MLSECPNLQTGKTQQARHEGGQTRPPSALHVSSVQIMRAAAAAPLSESTKELELKAAPKMQKALDGVRAGKPKPATSRMPACLDSGAQVSIVPEAVLHCKKACDMQLKMPDGRVVRATCEGIAKVRLFGCKGGYTDLEVKAYAMVGQEDLLLSVERMLAAGVTLLMKNGASVLILPGGRRIGVPDNFTLQASVLMPPGQRVAAVAQVPKRAEPLAPRAVEVAQSPAKAPEHAARPHARQDAQSEASDEQSDSGDESGGWQIAGRGAAWARGASSGRGGRAVGSRRAAHGARAQTARSAKNC